MRAIVVVGLVLLLSAVALAEEPYFVTYSHHMEEPGDLELATQSVFGSPRAGNSFLGSLFEIEYGVNTWWTTEFYLGGQSTAGINSTFTGFRWENRFRPLLREHKINPVLYVEFANINESDRSLKEIVGHDGVEDALEFPDRSEKEREIELKLILSSNVKGWNISENFIAEKNLAAEPWEFGYAFGVSRPLSLMASAKACTFCRENFAVGAELYGGLGDWHSFGLKDTSHYFAPVVSFAVPNGPNFKISPAIGLNDHSHGALFRFGVSYELEQIFARKR